MLYFLHLLKDSSDWLDPLNVFQYQTFRAAGACLTAFLLTVLFGNKVILKLVSLKVGQPIRTREEVNELAELHGGKAGTPTMGGVLIVGAVLISALLWARPTNPFVHALIFVTLGTGVLGFVDDLLKVSKKNSVGVRGKVKLIVQCLVSFVAVGYLYAHPDTADYIAQLYLPSIKDPVIEDMGIFTFVLLPIVIVGCSNAVNLTDGLDGLAAGCTVTTAMAYAILS